jgi:cell division septal protein FtsQ
MLRWLDRFPLVWLIVLALWMLVAPITPEPHVIEKIRMLSQGQLTRPVDIFDLLMHSAPTLLLLVRLARLRKKS